MKLLKNKNIKYVAFIIIAVIVIVSTVFFNLFTKKENAVETYIDGVHSDNLPAKDSGYIVEKVVCDNDKNPTWNNDNWMIEHSEHWQKESCSVYFKKLESFTLADRTFYLNEMQKCPSINSDGTVTVEGAEETDGYLCRAKDAYGDSYYYRGNVTNNYVKFADKYWRIVRYNGDGTVRVIYDGTTTHANGESSKDRQIGKIAFNDSVIDNTYVGYMYGNRTNILTSKNRSSSTIYDKEFTYYIAKEYDYDVVADKFILKNPIAIKTGDMSNAYVGYYYFENDDINYSNTYIYRILNVKTNTPNIVIDDEYITYATTSKEAAQTNSNDSKIKSYLDLWYENNIKGTVNEQYVKDNLFCNDRSFEDTGNGYGSENTSYRVNYADLYYKNKMMLTCVQKNDAFTVNDTLNGNGALTYGVGLITIDEVILAGGWKSANLKFYLYNGQDYWTMTPFNFFSFFASEGYVAHHSKVNSLSVSHEFGVRPVLNLCSDILKKGSGTADDPFHLSEN